MDSLRSTVAVRRRGSFKKIVGIILFMFLGLNSFAELRCFAQLLPEEEVEVVRTISLKLQNTYWNLSRSSCAEGFNVTFPEKILSNVTCNCSYNDSTICHVTNIQLKGLNLKGTLPAEFGDLRFLQEIDLSRNYINGSIPETFAQLPLKTLSLYGNRLSGRIPTGLGDISTLEDLNLEHNQLEGPLPPNLGRLSNLWRLVLSSNNLTGTIPETFGNLKNLTDFRIDGNEITGKIPDFIGNWTKMKLLSMQGTLMQGPFPSAISELKNLTELIISDLNGSSTRFPNLEGMTKMKNLILRNCSIIGTIQEYIGKMIDLKILDLSFNNLSGPIPRTFETLDFDFLLLSHNSLTGEIPPWILSRRKPIDVSYNSFTSAPGASCQSSKVNLVSSASNLVPNSSQWCLKKDLPCFGKPRYYSLFINCGGGRTNFDDNEYEEDKDIEGPSYFYSVQERWAYSSSGVFLGKQGTNYIATSSDVTGGEVYGTARLAPNSLKYYGLCMRKGSYRVRLHFAEIMFTNDANFSSLGKRIFDVSIQGNVVLRDFNIMEEARGAGRGIFKDFNNVIVNGSTLEIHLYWTGRGTTSIPDKGVYGPLISAITVKPNYDPTAGLSVGAIVGIVAASSTMVLLIIFALWKKGYLWGKNIEDKELRALDLQTGHFTLRQIKAATNNFDITNKIGEGGFGPVYKGVLLDGAVIAVKQLSSKSKQGTREFVNEVGMITALQHPNLVRLYGCCIEGNQLLLVYEYMEHNCLAHALFGHKEQRLNLDWPRRKKICLGIARGLAYLHEESLIKIVHRDIKATNVLLDKDLNAKISDFGLAKLDEEENTHISTRIAGTIGYMAPEYAMRGYLTDKADVYSFGIVALEIVSGKSNTNYRPKEEFVHLLDWAYVLQEQGNLLELVDSSLGVDYSEEEAMRMLNLALLCTNPSPTLRPSMSSVVRMLEGKIPVQAPLVKRSSTNEDMRFKAFENLLHDGHTHTSTFSLEKQVTGSVSMDGPWIDSSSSLYSKDDSIENSSSRRLLPNLCDNLD